MSRTPNASKHPAIAAKLTGLQEISDDSGKGKLSDLDHWSELTGTEQLLLSNYLFHRDLGVAAKVTGVSLQWVHETCKGVSGFQEILDYVMEYPKELAKAIAEEALPMGMVRLKEIIDSSDSPQAVIRATKELRESALSLGDQPWIAGGGSTTNFITIHPFLKSPSEDNVVESQ